MRTRVVFLVLISAALTTSYGCIRVNDCVGAICEDGDGAGGTLGMGGEPVTGGTPSPGGETGMGGQAEPGGTPAMGGEPAGGGEVGMGGEPAAGGEMMGPSVMAICRAACALILQCELNYILDGERLTRGRCANLCPDALRAEDPTWVQFTNCLEPLARAEGDMCALRDDFYECTGQAGTAPCDMDANCGAGEACHNGACEAVPDTFCEDACTLRHECGLMPGFPVEDCAGVCAQLPRDDVRWAIRDYYCAVDTLMPPDACSEERVFSCMGGEACDASNPCRNGNDCVEYSCGPDGGVPGLAGTCENPIGIDADQSVMGWLDPGMPSEHMSGDPACARGTAEGAEQIFFFSPANNREHCIRVDPQFNAVLYVRTDDCFNQESPTFCGQTFMRESNSLHYPFTPVQGGAYFIFVDGYGDGVGGEFSITVSEGRCVFPDDPG